MDKILEDKLRAIALDAQNGRGVEAVLNDLAFLPEPVLALLGSALQRAYEKKESSREAMEKRVDAARQEMEGALAKLDAAQQKMAKLDAARRGMEDALAELEVIEEMLAKEGGA